MTSLKQYRALRKEYLQWAFSPQGEVALKARLMLLRHLLSGWPRRSRSVLVMHAGRSAFPELLYDCGFSVTCQEDDPAQYTRLCEQNKKHLPCVLAAPDHLPFDDRSFDFTVAISGIEYWLDPLAVLQEISRVSCSGCILLFANKLSLFWLETLLGQKRRTPLPSPPRWALPRHVRSLATQAFGPRVMTFASVLYGPGNVWPYSLKKDIAFVSPLPLGAFAGLRVDFAPMTTGTMMPVCIDPAISSCE